MRKVPFETPRRDAEACIARMAELLAPWGVASSEVPNDFDAESLSALLARHGLFEIDRIASFPIEMFLLMGEGYVDHSEFGRAYHGRWVCGRPSSRP